MEFCERNRSMRTGGTNNLIRPPAAEDNTRLTAAAAALAQQQQPGFRILAPMLALSIGKLFYLPVIRTLPTGSTVIASSREILQARSLMTVPHILGRYDFPSTGRVGEASAQTGVKIRYLHVSNRYSTFLICPRRGFCDRGRWIAVLRTSDQETLVRWHQYLFLAQTTTGISGGSEKATMSESNRSRKTASKAQMSARRRDRARNGEKALPWILEKFLEESHLVNTAVAFGESQFELGVIVDPSTYPADVEEFKKSIRPDAKVPLGYQNKTSVVQAQPFDHHLDLSDDVLHDRWTLNARSLLSGAIFISPISVVGQYPQCHDGARFVPEEIMKGKERHKQLWLRVRQAGVQKYLDTGGFNYERRRLYYGFLLIHVSFPPIRSGQHSPVTRGTRWAHED
ncbi:hypothetical protein GGS21DRAFT_488491 [Xylaria nigripes]|nr:hypothetical protein GGS21DRAFT_488491 [Xylaria nigripes]